MSVFISDIDTAKLYVQFLIGMNKTVRDSLRALKNEGKVQLGNPKSGRRRLRERSLMRAFNYKV